MNKPTYEDIIKMLLKFRDDRDWKQFHDSKNLALAISIEASELNSDYINIANERIKAWEKVDIDEYFKKKKVF